MGKITKIVHKNTLLLLLFAFGTIFTSFITNQNNLEAKTLYDERRLCIESKGVWREFGSDCADSCALDRGHDRLCVNKITYSCDCLSERCWDYYQCINNKEYQKEAKKDEAERIIKIKEEHPELFIKRKIVQQAADGTKPKDVSGKQSKPGDAPTNGAPINDPTQSSGEPIKSAQVSIEDQIASCASGNGIWKKFSNGCVDSCISKSGPSICASVVTDSCECGENRCWNGEGCIFTSDFR